MSSRELIDERFADLVSELRSARLAPPPELRQRVRAIAAAPAAEPRPSLLERVRLRRAALVLVPVSLAAVVSAAMVQGLVSSGERKTVDVAVERIAPPAAEDAKPVLKAGARDSEQGASLPPGRRLVDYRVQMRLRVANLDELSRATVRTMRTVRRLGGYVGSVRYSSPSVRGGDAVIVVRVPVARMQNAILAFSELGTIVSQSISLTDVQKAYDRQVEQVGRLRTLIARTERRLRDEELPASERAALELQLVRQRADLVALVRRHEATGERGRMATARLSLTTFRPPPRATAATEPSRLGRALDDSGRVLAKELLWALYGLIVAGPLLVLGLLALGARRARRRRSERQLLARVG